jgi:hypothetical protein
MDFKMKTLLALILSLSSIIYSQELNCRVVVNYESLPVVNRQILEGFSQVVEDYMNNTKFTDIDWGEKIECSMNILFLSAPSEITYNAQIIVVSQRPIYKSSKNSPMLRINDNSWAFRYEKNQTLYASQSTFDPITSLLDYYANIIIGLDTDSFEKLGGSPYFSKAFNIVNLGNTSGSSSGWQQSSSSYSRWGLVSDLLNEKYRPFREAFYEYHYNGIDIYPEDPKTAQANIANLVYSLEIIKDKVNVNSVLLRTFFDAKSGEIVEYLKGYPDEAIFKTLKKIDPSHASTYDDAVK